MAAATLLRTRTMIVIRIVFLQAILILVGLKHYDGAQAFLASKAIIAKQYHKQQTRRRRTKKTTKTKSPSPLFFHFDIDIDIDAGVECVVSMIADKDALGVGASLFGPENKITTDIAKHALQVSPSNPAATTTILPPAPPLTTTTTATATTIATTSETSMTALFTIAAATTTPELESEVLLDVSHLFLDFSIFVTESKPFLKMAQVIGRILILAQDYIPDKHVSPEELGIQIVMIWFCISSDSNRNTTSSSTTTTTPTTSASAASARTFRHSNTKKTKNANN